MEEREKTLEQQGQPPLAPEAAPPAAEPENPAEAIQSMVHTDEERREEAKEEQAARRRRRTTILGTVVAVFALVGFVTVAGWLIGGIGDLISGRDPAEGLRTYLQPVVMLDPGTFDSLDEADETFIKQASIWSAIYTYGQTDKYEYTTMNELIVPSTDVDMACAALFGEDRVFEHTSFTTLDNYYHYDTDLKSYLVPVSGMGDPYQCEIGGIETLEDGTLAVTVNYLTPTPFWIDDPSALEEREPDKQRIYKLQETERGYQLIAIEVTGDSKAYS